MSLNHAYLCLGYQHLHYIEYISMDVWLYRCATIWAMNKTPVAEGKRDYPSYVGIAINHEIRIPIRQPGFNGKWDFFFVAHLATITYPLPKLLLSRCYTSETPEMESLKLWWNQVGESSPKMGAPLVFGINLIGKFRGSDAEGDLFMKVGI